ncbi:MAG: MarR family winged helix-turn-helix transcriptional regulator [Planctomycetota bacterium]|jgi:DNA-binding MarR family transcriptional regulator
MIKKGGHKKDIHLDSFVEAISLLTLELGRHPEFSSILPFGQETLLTLLAHSGKTSLKDIKTNLNINTFQVSRLLSSLENYVEGERKVPLILREVNRDDKRQWDISISNDGRRVLTEELHRRRLRGKKLLAPLTQEEKAAFMSIIQKMIAGMREE